MIKGERDTLNTQEISELNTQITLANTAKGEADARLKEIKSILSQKGAVDTSADVINSPTIQQLNEKLVAARSKLTELSATYLEKHPSIIAARKDVNDITRQIRREALKVVSSLEGQAKVAQSRAATLEQQLSELKKQAASENLDEVRLRELERNAAGNRTLLESLLVRYAEANAIRTVAPTVGVARLIEEARAPNQVSFPKKGPVMLLSSLAGLALGLGLAFLLSLLSATTAVAGTPVPQFTAPDVAPYSGPAKYPDPPLVTPAPSAAQQGHIAGNGASVSVPSLFDGSEPTSEPAKQVVEQVAVAHSVDSSETRNAEPVIQKNPDVLSYAVSVVENQIAAGIRPHVSFSRIAGEALDGAGAAIAVARAIAARGRKVLVIDADSENLGVQTILGLAAGVGMSDAALGRASFTRVITRDPDSKVHIMRFGNTGSEAAMQAIAQKMPAMLKGLDSIYDLVVLHGGPARRELLPLLMPFSISFILAPSSKRSEVSAAAESLVQNGIEDVHFIQLAEAV